MLSCMRSFEELHLKPFKRSYNIERVLKPWVTFDNSNCRLINHGEKVMTWLYQKIGGIFGFITILLFSFYFWLLLYVASCHSLIIGPLVSK